MAEGNAGHAAPADLHDPAATQAAAYMAVSRLGGLDLLVNAAGIWQSGPLATLSLPSGAG